MDAKTKVVLHFKDGRLIKGHTYDFVPGKERFHVAHGPEDATVIEVATSDLKAVFYVRSFDGLPGHVRRKDFSEAEIRKIPGLKLKITFADGEVLWGTTAGWSPGRPGFFVVPLDRDGNNERVYVLTGATRSVEPVR